VRYHTQGRRARTGAGVGAIVRGENVLHSLVLGALEGSAAALERTIQQHRMNR
jgi:hypothetical protein